MSSNNKITSFLRLSCIMISLSVVDSFSVASPSKFHRNGIISRHSGIFSRGNPRGPTLPLNNDPAATLGQMLSNEDVSNAPLEAKELTPEMVVEMIEVSFINACLQLAKGYVDVMKLFIVSIKAAFGMGFSISELNQKLEDFPIQSANRPLMQEEINLRATWMNLIYMVLEYLNENDDEFSVENSTVDPEIREKYDKYIQFIADWRKKQNFDDRDAAAMVAELKVEDVMQGCSGASSSITDALEVAMLPQNLRVALLTLTVIEEEKRCLDDVGGGPTPPQPPIPGTN